MALLLEPDAVFLHVPKTGGTWVTRVLDRAGLVRARFASKHADMERAMHCFRHYPLRYAEKAIVLGPRWQHRARVAYKFCFVRHPFRWYESWWMYMSGCDWRPWGIARGGRRKWHPNAALDGLGSDDFNRFVRNVLEAQPGFVSGMFESYATAEIDFVGRQESLAADLCVVLARIGCVPAARLDLPRINESAAVARPSWDVGLRNEVAAAEARALRRFGYEAEDDGEGG